MKKRVLFGLVLLTMVGASMAFGQTWKERGWGRWEFEVSVKYYDKKTGRLTNDQGVQKWVGIAQNVEAAKKMALDSNVGTYYSGQNSGKGTPKFAVLKITCSDKPSGGDYTKFLRDVGTSLNALGSSKEVTEAFAKLKGFKKVASKMPVAGKIIQCADVGNDLLKFEDYIKTYKKATTQEQKDQAVEKLVELGAKQLQTVIGLAVPVVGLIDAVNTLTGMAFDYWKKHEYDNALKDKKMVAKKDEYDKQSWALKPSDDRYKIEVMAYMKGSSREDIENIRNVKAFNSIVLEKAMQVGGVGTKFLYDWFAKDWNDRV